MGNVNRPPTADELEKMEALVDKGMRDGAWGLSTGLIYNPGTYAKTDELIALAKVAAAHGGILRQPHPPRRRRRARRHSGGHHDRQRGRIAGTYLAHQMFGQAACGANPATPSR